MNPLVTKTMKSIIRAYKADRDHLVRLDEDFFVGTFAETFPWKDASGKPVELPILDFRCDAFSIVDRKLVCYKAKEPRSDGATFAPDKVGKVDLASGYIAHDDIYDAMKKIAEDPAWKAAGWTEEAVRALADAVLAWMIRYEELLVHPDRPPWIHRVYHAAVRAFGGLAHRIGIRCLALAFAFAVAGCGCAQLPEVFTPSGERPVYTVVKRGATAAPDPLPAPSEEADAGVHAGAADGVSSDPATGGSGKGDGSSSGVAGSVSLDFRFGGFKAKDPQEVAGCRIGNLKVGKDGLSYKWLEGGCEKLGASSREDYSQTVACAFYWDEKTQRWVGGKFDWISTSRTSRSFKNIKEGYGGWDSAAFFAAGKHGFCVVSKDGRKRSNFIED